MCTSHFAYHINVRAQYGSIAMRRRGVGAGKLLMSDEHPPRDRLPATWLIPGGGEEVMGPSSLDSSDTEGAEVEEIHDDAEMEEITDWDDGMCTDDSTCVTAEDSPTSGVTEWILQLEMELALEACWTHHHLEGVDVAAAAAASHRVMQGVYLAYGRPLPPGLMRAQGPLPDDVVIALPLPGCN